MPSVERVTQGTALSWHRSDSSMSTTECELLKLNCVEAVPTTDVQVVKWSALAAQTLSDSRRSNPLDGVVADSGGTECQQNQPASS